MYFAHFCYCFQHDFHFGYGASDLCELDCDQNRDYYHGLIYLNCVMPQLEHRHHQPIQYFCFQYCLELRLILAPDHLLDRLLLLRFHFLLLGFQSTEGSRQLMNLLHLLILWHLCRPTTQKYTK